MYRFDNVCFSVDEGKAEWSRVQSSRSIASLLWAESSRLGKGWSKLVKKGSAMGLSGRWKEERGEDMYCRWAWKCILFFISIEFIAT
tara:strand:+ start:661 stop:921 length:261 start_codon:yes stop_codon:yes gene_type:complete